MGHPFVAQAGRNVITSGVWVYNKALRLPDEKGYLMLIDSEGTERGNDSITSQVTAIACVMSSLLVLHINQDFSNAAMDALARMKDLVHFARGEGHDQIYPRLLIASRSISEEWLAQEFRRDFGNSLESSEFVRSFLGDPATHRALDQILQSQLSPQPGQEERNRVREAIVTWFSHRYYHITLNAENADRRLLTQYKLQEGSPFAESMNCLLRRLVDLTTPKLFAGLPAEIDGMLDLMPQFLHQIKSNLFSIPSVLHFLHANYQEKINRDAMARYLSHYQDGVDIGDLATLERLHAVALDDAVQFALAGSTEHNIMASVRENGMASLAAKIDMEFLQRKARVQELIRRQVAEEMRVLGERAAQNEEEAAKAREEIGALQGKLNDSTARTAEIERQMNATEEASQKLERELQITNARLMEASRHRGGGGGGRCILF